MWNYVSSNDSCNKLSRFKIHKEHLERLIQAKARIDNKGKKTPQFLRIPILSRMPAKDRKRKIDFENKIILNRMYEIQYKKSPYNFEVLRPADCPAFKASGSEFNKKHKFDEIKKRNQWLCCRFFDAKSYYPTKDFIKQNNYYTYIGKGLHRNHSNPNINFVTFSEFKKNIFNEIHKSHGSLPPRIRSAF